MGRRMLAAGVTAALGVLILAAPVAAFPLTNCTLQATGLAADGSTIGSIQSGADDATQDHPFLVDWDGTVSYKGSSQIEMKNNTWHVDVFGIPTPLSGSDPNTADNRDGSGTVGVSANAPFRITGLYFVSGSLTGSGGTCTGSGWFKLTGDPIGTIPFFVGPRHPHRRHPDARRGRSRPCHHGAWSGASSPASGPRRCSSSTAHCRWARRRRSSCWGSASSSG